MTITSDWQNSDYYIGAVKARIISQCPNLNLLDISHNVESFAVQQAAFILKASYMYFPKGTIHIIAVDSEPYEKDGIVVAKHNGHFFICNNNGCLPLIFDAVPDEYSIAKVGLDFDISTLNFIELNVFVDIVAHINSVGSIPNYENSDIKVSTNFAATDEENIINGEVIYIDSYGNAITNITRKDFEKTVNLSKFEISFGVNNHSIRKISNSYKTVESGTLLGIFNSLGLLEIAVCKGKASTLFALNRKSIIRVKYNLP